MTLSEQQIFLFVKATLFLCCVYIFNPWQLAVKLVFFFYEQVENSNLTERDSGDQWY